MICPAGKCRCVHRNSRKVGYFSDDKRDGDRCYAGYAEEGWRSVRGFTQCPWPEKQRVIHHGGCLDCVSQEKYGPGRCDGCQYKRPRWSLPDLFVDKDGLKRGEKKEGWVFEEIKEAAKWGFTYEEYKLAKEIDGNRECGKTFHAPAGFIKKYSRYLHQKDHVKNKIERIYEGWNPPKEIPHSVTIDKFNEIIDWINAHEKKE